MSESSNTDLWGPIDRDNWQQILHIKSKIAVEQDVIDGRAVFYVDPKDSLHEPLNISIPSIAYYTDEETNEKVLVVIIQAEKADDLEVIGIRYFNGGNAVCSLHELEIINE